MMFSTMEDRPLIWGCNTINHSKGLLGQLTPMFWLMPFQMLLRPWSIARLFPDTDPKYKDADSIVPLKEGRRYSK